MSCYPYADSSAIRAALLASAIDIGSPGWDPASGYGLPDTVRMAQMIPPAPPDISPSATGMNDIHVVNVSLDSVSRFTEFHDEISLFPGWNFISIPYSLKKGNNTAGVFSGVNTNDHTIWKFFNQSGGWVPVQHNETLMSVTGYWIYSNDTYTIPLQSGIFIDHDRNSELLSPGWHAMGLIGTDPVPARIFMESFNQSWSHIFVFDRQIQEFKKPIIKEREDQFSDSRLLYPGDGFWCYSP